MFGVYSEKATNEYTKRIHRAACTRFYNRLQYSCIAVYYAGVRLCSHHVYSVHWRYMSRVFCHVYLQQMPLYSLTVINTSNVYVKKKVCHVEYMC